VLCVVLAVCVLCVVLAVCVQWCPNKQTSPIPIHSLTHTHSKTVVPGGGAVEGALSVYMESLADTLGTREQISVAAFAEALLVIPRTLAVNGACDATELIAKLRAYHHLAQSDEKKKNYKYMVRVCRCDCTRVCLYVCMCGLCLDCSHSHFLSLGHTHTHSLIFLSLSLIHTPSLTYSLTQGLDLINGVVRDNLAAGVIEPTIGKIKVRDSVCV
jgi:hypothetical protein